MDVDYELPRLLREAGIATEEQAEKLADLIAKTVADGPSGSYVDGDPERVRGLIKT